MHIELSWLKGVALTMTKGRDIAAESISDILEVAHLQRRSGLMRVECSQGKRLEEGELYILAGQPIYARTGKLLGHEALRYLLNWRNIYFSFSTDVPRPPANISPAFTTSNATSSLYAAPPGTMPDPVARGPRWSAVEERDTSFPLNRSRSASGSAWLVPQKTDLGRDILTLPLTRRQRLVYFLVNGQRTIGDLARTSGKAISDIELILSELQGQGLVVI